MRSMGRSPRTSAARCSEPWPRPDEHDPRAVGRRPPEPAGQLDLVALRGPPPGDAEIEPLRELGEPQLHVAVDRLLDRREHLRARPSDRLGERLGLRMRLRGSLERPLRVGHHDPRSGRQQLRRRRHVLEEERRERVGTLEAEPVGQSLETVSEPIGHVGGSLRGHRPELTVGEELPHRRDLDGAHLRGRELRRRRELAEPLDLIAPVLEPSRTPGDAGEDVDDSSSNGEFPAMLDHVDAEVAELREPLCERVRRDLHARRELQRRSHTKGRWHHLHRREVGSDHDERPLGDAEAPESVGPSGRDLGRRVHPLVGQRVPRREEGDALRAQIGADLGGELLRLPGAGAHHHQGCIQRDRQPGQEEVLPRVGPRHDRARAFEEEPLERLGRDEGVQHLPERHPISSTQREQPRSRRDGASEKEV